MTLATLFLLPTLRGRIYCCYGGGGKLSLEPGFDTIQRRLGAK